MYWAAFDFETANERRDSACAIGVALVDDGVVVDAREWLIRPPGMRFDVRNVAVHGIRPHDVEHADEWPEVWEQIAAYTSHRTFVAHNAGFDVGVLRGTMDTFEMPHPTLQYFCTRVVGRRAWPGRESYGLAPLSADFGIDLNHHDALSDARACAEIAIRARVEADALDAQDMATKLGFRLGTLDAREHVSCKASPPVKAKKSPPAAAPA